MTEPHREPLSEPLDENWPNRFPWAAVLAALIVWAVDSWALSPSGPWDLLTDRMTDEYPMERGVVSDRVEIAVALEQQGDGPLVAVMGSSRAHAGIHLHHVAKEATGIVTLGLAHAGMSPYEIRGAMEELLPLEPDVVVILLSEFDTHRPLRLMPQTAPGSFAALVELGEFAGLPIVWEHRTTFLQVALASVLECYRFREVFGAAGLTDYRMFAVHGSRRAEGLMQIPFLLEGDPMLPMNVSKELEALAVLYPHLSLWAAREGMTQCRSITRGPHAIAQIELITNAVQAVVQQGGRVLLVEGPLAPATDGFYDASIRQDFLDMVTGLCADERVSFLPLAESGPFPQELFADLTHLQKEGALQLSKAVGQRVAAILAAQGN